MFFLVKWRPLPLLEIVLLWFIYYGEINSVEWVYENIIIYIYIIWKKLLILILYMKKKMV
jgi:hypothetical protein